MNSVMCKLAKAMIFYFQRNNNTPRTVPLVLHGTGGIERTHRSECVGRTCRIP